VNIIYFISRDILYPSYVLKTCFILFLIIRSTHTHILFCLISDQTFSASFGTTSNFKVIQVGGYDQIPFELTLSAAGIAYVSLVLEADSGDTTTVSVTVM